MAAYTKRWVLLFACGCSLTACGHFSGQSAFLWPLLEQGILPIVSPEQPPNLPAAAAPVMSPADGTYSADQNVTLASSTVGADIRYTTDGSDPTETSALYSAPIPVAGNGTMMTIKAIAIKSGMSNSAIVTNAYTINYSQVSTPAISPVGGTYNSNQSISITCATGGATIRYTLDGTAPNAGSTAYGGPIPLTGTGTHTIKAIAILGGMTDSTIRTEVYTIQDAAAPTPGGGGTINTSNTQLNSITLGWAAANDNYTPSANLEYLVCQSILDNLDTLANTQNNCTPVNGMPWTANLTTVIAAGLTSNTIYYFNVLVRDLASPANVSIYTPVSHWTLGPDGDADGVPDTFDNCPHDANSTQAITGSNAGPYGDACTLNGHAWIEFNTTATGANIATDQVNFPVLVRITDPAIIDAVQTGAPDLRFVDGTISHPTPGPYLKYEVEFWDQATDTAAVWVLVPRVYGNDNTHHITMYYDDAVAGAVADAQAASTVFDTANNFSAVWHLHTFNDATTNVHNGTNNGTTDVTGLIGHGKSFNGTSFIQIAGLIGSPANLTLSAWVQLTAADTKGSEVISLGDYATIRMDDADAGLDNGTHAAFYDGSNWSALIHSPGLFYAGPQWHYLTATFDDTNHVQKLYVDGVEVVSDSFMMSIAYSGQGSHTFIGTHGNGGTIYDFTGVMDEVRVANAPRSADWIKLEYQNQRSSGQCLVTVTPH